MHEGGKILIQTHLQDESIKKSSQIRLEKITREKITWATKRFFFCLSATTVKKLERGDYPTSDVYKKRRLFSQASGLIINSASFKSICAQMQKRRACFCSSLIFCFVLSLLNKKRAIITEKRKKDVIVFLANDGLRQRILGYVYGGGWPIDLLTAYVIKTLERGQPVVSHF